MTLRSNRKGFIAPFNDIQDSTNGCISSLSSITTVEVTLVPSNKWIILNYFVFFMVCWLSILGNFMPY